MKNTSNKETCNYKTWQKERCGCSSSCGCQSSENQFAKAFPISFVESFHNSWDNHCCLNYPVPVLWQEASALLPERFLLNDFRSCINCTLLKEFKYIFGDFNKPAIMRVLCVGLHELLWHLHELLWHLLAHDILEDLLHDVGEIEEGSHNLICL